MIKVWPHQLEQLLSIVYPNPNSKGTTSTNQLTRLSQLDVSLWTPTKTDTVPDNWDEHKAGEEWLPTLQRCIRPLAARKLPEWGLSLQWGGEPDSGWEVPIDLYDDWLKQPEAWAAFKAEVDDAGIELYTGPLFTT